jgi:hypothetical protein
VTIPILSAGKLLSAESAGKGFGRILRSIKRVGFNRAKPYS